MKENAESSTWSEAEEEEGPIAPLSVGQSAARIGTPTAKTRAVSPLVRSKNLLSTQPLLFRIKQPDQQQQQNQPDDKPYRGTITHIRKFSQVGHRRQRRWDNDHHFENQEAVNSMEHLMEHMTISVDWKSNFEKLATLENMDLYNIFRKTKENLGTERRHDYNGHRRKDQWDDAEQMFLRIDKRARALYLRSFPTFLPFLQALEYVVVHFVKWDEVPSDLEISPYFKCMLLKPMHIHSRTKPTESTNAVSHKRGFSLRIPLKDSPIHRLLIHATCQFYGLRSKSENSGSGRVVVVRKTKKNELKIGAEEESFCSSISLCEFLLTTRFPINSKESDGPHTNSDTESENIDEFYVVAGPKC